MIHFACSHCGTKFRVKPEFAGRSTRCPTCKQALAVPAPEPTPVEVPAGPLDGSPSSLARAGVDAGVTLRQGADSRADRSPALPPPVTPGAAGPRYVVERELARGGMGAVLRAVDRDLRREVALKYLLDQADAAKRLRFVEEAQITGQLEHPNIVPIHELGVDDRQRLFFTMKLVQGQSLAQVLDELRHGAPAAVKTYSLPHLLTVLVNVCHALAYAHARGVTHRDLKPANIMLGDFGEVYVMDWGLAKVQSGAGPAAAGAGHPDDTVPPDAGPRPAPVWTGRADEADLTQDGTVLGTPAYMAPEQAAGRLDAVGPLSDVYALGALLYEILTLQPPVDREGGYLATLWQAMEGRVLPPEQRAPARARAGLIPRELSAVALKALARDPADRYPSVEALRQDVERFQEGRSVSAKADSVRELAWKLVKRNKLATAFTTALAVVLAGGLVANRLAQREADRARADAQARQEELVDRTRQAVPALVVAARQLANAGNFEGARKQVDLALLYEPTDAAGHLLKGQILLGQKDWAAAKGELEQALLQQDDPRVRRLLALCESGPVDDPGTQHAVAVLLGRQNVPGPAVPLLTEVATERAKREQQLSVYQNQVEVNWQGLGKRLTLGRNARFHLDLSGRRQVTSLEPLRGLPLHVLTLDHCGQVQDLEPLRGMPLASLNLSATRVQDLSPLRGMPLTELHLTDCGKLDLTPLQGMRLAILSIQRSGVEDLSPLQGMDLRDITLSPGKIKKGLAVLRQMKSLEVIRVGDGANRVPVAEFWKRQDSRKVK